MSSIDDFISWNRQCEVENSYNFFSSNQEKVVGKLFHELSMNSVSVDVIGEFWRNEKGISLDCLHCYVFLFVCRIKCAIQLFGKVTFLKQRLRYTKLSFIVAISPTNDFNLNLWHNFHLE